MRFILLSRQGKEHLIRSTLTKEHYIEVKMKEKADFAFTHADSSVWRKRLSDFQGPIFMYPHALDTWYNYDHGVQPWNRIHCNFVASRRTKEILEFLGYPRPIHIIGFPYLKSVQPLIPTTGNRILFAPHHTDRGKLHPSKRKSNLDVAGSLNTLKNWRVTAYISHSIEASGLYAMPRFTHQFSSLSLNGAINAIKKHDVIVAYGTFLQLAVALGKPAISWDQLVPFTGVTCDLQMRHPELMERWKYPVDLYDFSSPENAISVAKNPEVIAEWKREVLGGSFNPDPIRKIVKETMLRRHRPFA